MPTRRRLREKVPDSRSIDPTSRSTYGFCQGDRDDGREDSLSAIKLRDGGEFSVRALSLLTVIAPFNPAPARIRQLEICRLDFEAARLAAERTFDLKPDSFYSEAVVRTKTPRARRG